MKKTLLLVFMLTGCATNDINNPYDFSQFTNERLCASAKWVKATHNNHGVIDPYMREIKRRKLMTESDFGRIFDGAATVGDSACFMFAVYGKPNQSNYSRVNNTVYIQYIYNHFTAHKTYIYTENDIITAVQY